MYGPQLRWTLPRSSLMGMSAQAMADERERQEMMAAAGQMRQGHLQGLFGTAGQGLGALTKHALRSAAKPSAGSFLSPTAPGNLASPPPVFTPAQQMTGVPQMMGIKEPATAMTRGASALGDATSGAGTTLSQVLAPLALGYATYQGFETGKGLKGMAQQIKGMDANSQQPLLGEFKKAATTAALTGAASGAVPGAIIGQSLIPIPGAGAAIGALGGAALGGMGPAQAQISETGTPDRIKHLGRNLARGARMAAPAAQRFIPGSVPLPIARAAGAAGAAYSATSEDTRRLMKFGLRAARDLNQRTWQAPGKAVKAIRDKLDDLF